MPRTLLSQPGPGQYLPKISRHESKFRTEPQVGFGTSLRPEPNAGMKAHAGTPGPGHYGQKVQGGIGGKKFSIRSAPKPRDRLSLEPGPGAYGGVTSFG